MHREVPVRLGKERWETHTATVVQGAHRLLHLSCGFDYQLLSAINQSLILLRPVLRFFSLKSAFYSFPACGQLHRGQSAQAQQHKAQPEPGIADVTDFQNRLRLRRVGLFHRLVDLFPGDRTGERPRSVTVSPPAGKFSSVALTHVLPPSCLTISFTSMI